MAIPLRRASAANIAVECRSFFVTSSIANKRGLLQSDRAARLFIQVLYHYRLQRKYLLHSFVVMPDHFHALITVDDGMTIEKAAQLIKGGFAFRAGRELGFRAPVWQRGFSEVRIYDSLHLTNTLEYILLNPVRSLLAQSPEMYPYSSASGHFELDDVPQGLKPASPRRAVLGTSEDVP